MYTIPSLIQLPTPISIVETVPIFVETVPILVETVQEVVVKKLTYTDANRLAQLKYRQKYPAKYCAIQKKLYERKKLEPEWIAHFNERARGYAKKAYNLKKQAKIDAGEEIRPRGRPRKIKEESTEESISTE